MMATNAPQQAIDPLAQQAATLLAKAMVAPRRACDHFTCLAVESSVRRRRDAAEAQDPSKRATALRSNAR
jgi:hypothetical protein